MFHYVYIHQHMPQLIGSQCPLPPVNSLCISSLPASRHPSNLQVRMLYTSKMLIFFFTQSAYRPLSLYSSNSIYPFERHSVYIRGRYVVGNRCVPLLRTQANELSLKLGEAWWTRLTLPCLGTNLVQNGCPRNIVCYYIQIIWHTFEKKIDTWLVL